MLERLRTVADYQFGPGSGDALFPAGVEVSTRTSGRPGQVFLGGERLATFRPHVGLFTLSVLAAGRLHGALEEPRCRVYMNDEAAPFVAGGKTAFAKHVLDADEELRAGDEVLLVDGKDKLLGTGRATLSRIEMISFERGQAVEVREGVD